MSHIYWSSIQWMYITSATQLLLFMSDKWYSAILQHVSPIVLPKNHNAFIFDRIYRSLYSCNRLGLGLFRQDLPNFFASYGAVIYHILQNKHLFFTIAKSSKTSHDITNQERGKCSYTKATNFHHAAVNDSAVITKQARHDSYWCRMTEQNQHVAARWHLTLQEGALVAI